MSLEQLLLLTALLLVFSFLVRLARRHLAAATRPGVEPKRPVTRARPGAPSRRQSSAHPARRVRSGSPRCLRRWRRRSHPAGRRGCPSCAGARRDGGSC